MEKEEGKKSPPSRREFLMSSVAAVGGIVLAGLLFIRDSFLFLFPGRKEKDYKKFLVAKEGEIPVGKAKEITIANKPIFIVHLPEGYKVFSGICTHLGCIIKWKEHEKIFYCPCHKGRFRNDGTVIAGPPPRPLDEYKVEVDNSLVFIWIEKRRRGIQS